MSTIVVSAGVQWTPFTFPLVLATLLLWLEAVYLVDRWRTDDPVPGIGLVTGLIASIALTLTVYLVQLSLTTLPAKLALNPVQYAGLAPGSAFLLAYVLVYIGRGDLLDRRAYALLFAPPAVTVLIAATNEFHFLFWTDLYLDESGAWSVLVNDHGPLYVAFLFYTTLYVASSAVLLGREAIYPGREHRKLIAVMTAGTCIPLIGGVVYALGLVPPTFPPLSYLGFVLTAVIFAWPVFRADPFTVVPIANRTVVEQIDDGIVVADISGTVVSANPAATSLLDAAEPDLVDASLPEALGEAVADVDLDEHEGFSSWTASVGETVLDVSAVPLTQSGQRVGRLVRLTDVTDRQHRIRQLRRQNEYLDEFASVVSHDIATPLSVIEQRARLIEMSGEDEHVESILAATDRIRHLMDELLDLARQGKRVDETEPVDVESVALEAWYPLDEPGARLTVESSPTIEASRSRLVQLFENLFRNALDHARTPSDGTTEDGEAGGESSPDPVPPGPAGPDSPWNEGADAAEVFTRSPTSDADEDDATVHVRVGALPDGFYVADDGPGIPADEREDVFEQGYSHADSGTGLGLAIVRRIAAAHGWNVSITESAAGGARFEVTDVSTG